MTAASKPEPIRDGLTAKGRARLAEIKARNALVVAISGESWGTKLTPIQQRAFAEYMRRFNLDISEIDNLGGRPYRNGRYYMRRIAELAAQGRVDWYKVAHIGPNTELNELANAGEQWAIDERLHRMKERIRLEVPKDATFAYLVTVKMKELALPTEGVKYFIPGRQKLGWSKDQRGKREMVSADPVGDENPITSVETRAWRRCGRLCAAEIPELREQESEMEFAADATQEAVIAEAVRADDEQPETARVHQITEGPARPFVPGEYGNDNAAVWAPDGGHTAGVTEPVKKVVEPNPAATEAQRAAAQRSDYDDEPDFSGVAFPEDLNV